MTKLEKKRDELALEFCHPGVSLMEHEKIMVDGHMVIYKAGFDAALAELMPQVEKLVNAIETADKRTPRMRIALHKWREYVGKK